MGDRWKLPGVAEVGEKIACIHQNLHLHGHSRSSESEVFGRSLLPNAGARAHAARRLEPVFTFAPTETTTDHTQSHRTAEMKSQPHPIP